VGPTRSADSVVGRIRGYIYVFGTLRDGACGVTLVGLLCWYFDGFEEQFVRSQAPGVETPAATVTQWVDGLPVGETPSGNREAFSYALGSGVPH
jgi:hypothetical protein